MRFAVLGPLEVADEHGNRRDPGASRQRRLLLALLMWRGEMVSADRLVDLVWGDDVPRHPVRSLRTYISRLRAALDGEPSARETQVLASGPIGYALRLDGHHVDADEFEERFGESLVADDPQTALRIVEAALALWRGPAFAEVADEQWASPEVARLTELRLSALELRYRCLVDLGHHDEAIVGLERLVREEPLREGPHQQLMLALARAGRTAEATATFHRYRHRLAEETGLDPSHELGELHRRLLADGVVDAAEVGSMRHNIPPQRNSFVGREADARAVVELASSARLVTLTGIGGAGKTRLAVEAARRMLGHFPDGVRLVELASLADPKLVARQVAEAVEVSSPGAIGFGSGRSVQEDLAEALEGRRILLVIDNAEHLLDATADVVELLLDRCPQLSFLVTSREPLRCAGERIWPVGPLTTDAHGDALPDALQLLVDRTADVSPGFAVTADNRDILERICRGLDGIPLALELTAGRLAHLSPAEVADRLGDRLRLFAGGRRVDRQRTLQATIDWSYDLLDEDERALLRDLSVFAGETPLDAMEGICRRPSGDRLLVDVIGSLVGKSLVVAAPSDRGTRYRLLETVRLYAQDAALAAGEHLEARARHRDWFLTWLEATPWDHRIASPEVAEAADERHDDLRLALEHSRSQGRLDLVVRQLQAMSALFCVQGHLEEGHRWHASVVASGLPDPVDQARLSVHRAFIECWRSGGGSREPFEAVLADLTAATAVLPAGDRETALAHALVAVCHSSLSMDPDRMLGHATMAIDMALAAEAVQVAGFAASIAAGAHLYRRDPAAAVAAIEGVLQQPGWRDAHDGLRVRAHLATARHLDGDHPGAVRDATTALEHLAPAWRHDALGTLALASAGQGDLEAARGLLAEALAGLDAAGTRNHVRQYDVAIVAGALAVHEGDLQRACRLLATVRWATNPTTFGVYLAYRDELIRLMDRGERHAAVQDGRGLDVRDALAAERHRLRRPASEASDRGRRPQGGRQVADLLRTGTVRHTR